MKFSSTDRNHENIPQGFTEHCWRILHWVLYTCRGRVFLLLRPQRLTQVLTHYQCVFMEQTDESLMSSVDYSSFT